jgi:hypothetical protein
MAMPICVSFLGIDEPAAVINHQIYCNHFSYRHRTVRAAHIQSQQHYLLFKFQTLLNALQDADDGDLVALMTEDCVILKMFALERLCFERDYLLPLFSSEDRLPQEALQIWRNKAESRRLLISLIAQTKISLPVQSEVALTAGLDHAAPGEVAPGLSAVELCNVRVFPNWIGREDIFALILTDVEIYARTPEVFRTAFLAHINAVHLGQTKLLAFPAYEPGDLGQPFAVFNPGGAIAVVLFYTPNIACFGAIAETSFRRYCHRHNYTLYVYHQPLPEHPDVTGTWIKPFLLRRHLSAYEWVFWLDADILIINQLRKLEALIVGRDIVLAHDIGPWIFNAGALGFRRTVRNCQILDRVCDLIEAVEDRSHTYASGGDQTVLNNFFASLGWTSESNLDILSFNTPWFFRQKTSLMVHYYGMQTQYRAIVMDYDFRVLSNFSDR